MANQIPYLFCRYELLVDEEPLDAKAQLVALKELQGQFYPNGPTAERAGLFDSVVMRPRSFTLGKRTVLTWSVGQTIGQRVAIKYNKRLDDLDRDRVDDGSLRYSDFVAVPDLGVLAVDDRQGSEYLGGAQAAHRFRSIFRQLNGADASVLPAADYADIQKALKKWTISSFGFTVRPFNPHSPSDMATKLADALKARNAARATGRWTAEPGEGLKADDEMQGILDLTEAGYGQIAIKGETGGHTAQIKKSTFYEDTNQNLNSLNRPKEMRVMIGDTDMTEKAVFKQVAEVLVKFYGN